MSLRYLFRISSVRKVLNTAHLNRNVFLNVSPILCHKYSSTVNTQTEDKAKKKKTTPIPKITLISGNDLTVTTLEEAQKLSKRRDLKLVKVTDLDTKTQRPIYKLMSGSEYHAEDIKQRALKKENKKSSIKGEKVLIINHNIFEHDLQTHIKKLKKWIEKRLEVRVVINGDSGNMEKAEAVFKSIESSLEKETRILQKLQKGSDIKFQVMPPKLTKEEKENL